MKIKLRDKTKLEGYISDAGEESLVIKDAITGAANRVAYTPVKTVKGSNLSTGEWITIGALVGVKAAPSSLLLVRLGTE